MSLLERTDAKDRASVATLLRASRARLTADRSELEQKKSRLEQRSNCSPQDRRMLDIEFQQLAQREKDLEAAAKEVANG